MSNDTRLQDLTSLVEKVQAGDISTDTLYELVLMGYKCFKSGSGLPTNYVYETIEKASSNNSDQIVGD